MGKCDGNLQAECNLILVTLANHTCVLEYIEHFGKLLIRLNRGSKLGISLYNNFEGKSGISVREGN